MSRFWLILLLLGLVCSPMAIAQSPAPAQPQKQHKADADADEDDEKPAADSPNVPLNAPVITIKGVCDAPKTAAASAKADCKTVITRAEFEKLANTLQPGMQPQVKRQLASAYPRLLIGSKEAQKRGLEKNPHYLEMLHFAKMQLLNQELTRELKEEADKVPQKDIEDYYAKNSSAYEQAAVQRVFVPKNKQIDAKDPQSDEYKAQLKAGEEAMAKEADDLRARAAAGEDFDKLQKEAYEFAGLKTSPPATSIPKVRRTNQPPTHASVFDLKPGDVSSEIKDPSGTYFYKMQSKVAPPLDEVKDEIKATLQNQRMRDLSQKVQESAKTELNESYFSAGAPAPPAGAMGMKPPMNAKPPADADDKQTAKPAAQR